MNLDYEFKTIEENFLAGKGRDYAASRGEYLNGILMASYLGYEFIDAAEVVLFDENGVFLLENQRRALRPPREVSPRRNSRFTVPCLTAR